MLLANQQLNMAKKKLKEIDKVDSEMDGSEVAMTIDALKTLQEHPGWKFIKKILDENVFNQERKILNDLYKKDLIYNEEDLEKQIRRIYIDIRDLPEKEINRMSGSETEEEEYDPYYKKAREINR